MHEPWASERAAYSLFNPFSNVIVDGEPLGSLGDGELRWHTDMSNHPVPPKASILHALEVSSEGGETEFCNLYSATADLPAYLRSAIQGEWAHQDGTYDAAGAPQRSVEVAGVRTETPHAKHPLMRRHPDTDRPVLYLGVNGFAITQLFGEQWRVIEASICVQWSQNGGSFSFQRSACRSSVAW